MGRNSGLTTVLENLHWNVHWNTPILANFKKKPPFSFSLSNTRQSKGNSDICIVKGTSSLFYPLEFNAFKFCQKFEINMK